MKHGQVGSCLCSCGNKALSLVDSQHGLSLLLQARVLASCERGNRGKHDWLPVPSQRLTWLAPGSLHLLGSVESFSRCRFRLYMLKPGARLAFLSCQCRRSPHLFKSPEIDFFDFFLKKIDLMILKMFAIFCNTKSITFFFPEKNRQSRRFNQYFGAKI
jgi:hypothetical protein